MKLFTFLENNSKVTPFKFHKKKNYNRSVRIILLPFFWQKFVTGTCIAFAEVLLFSNHIKKWYKEPKYKVHCNYFFVFLFYFFFLTIIKLLFSYNV